MKKKKIVLGAIVLFLVIVGITVSVIANNKPINEEHSNNNYSNNLNNIIVEVKGEVYRPGIYIVLEGSRVNDIINLCGGFTTNALTTNINLARVINDGELINIASKESITPISDKININSATVEELMTLSGIGETKAKSIVLYRNEKGNFMLVEDIMNVSGISVALFEKIKESICV